MDALEWRALAKIEAARFEGEGLAGAQSGLGEGREQREYGRSFAEASRNA